MARRVKKQCDKCNFTAAEATLDGPGNPVKDDEVVSDLSLGDNVTNSAGLRNGMSGLAYVHPKVKHVTDDRHTIE